MQVHDIICFFFYDLINENVRRKSNKEEFEKIV